MSGPGVGFEYPPLPVQWLKRDALLFANSIGCTSDELHFLFELHPDFAVFPTYPVILRESISPGPLTARQLCANNTDCQTSIQGCHPGSH